jgi:streptogramin lyase
MEYRQIAVIGGRGPAAGQFHGTLRGVWVDRQGNLLTAGDSQIRVYSPAGALLRRWNTAKPALAVGADDAGRVYAGEAGQIEVFDPAGKLLESWRDNEKLGEVTAFGFHKDNVLAGDARGRAIRRFRKTGEYLNSIGDAGRMKGLLIPNGVVDFSVDGAGIVHTANPGKHRVERYTLEGELLGHIGRFDGIDPAGFPGCCNPTNVSLGPQGQVFVTEKAGPRVKVLAADGQLVAVIATNVFDPNCKNMDIAVDPRGRVYVADTVRLEVRVFEPAAGRAVQ